MVIKKATIVPVFICDITPQKPRISRSFEKAASRKSINRVIMTKNTGSK
jgi:hypothetical protein